MRFCLFSYFELYLISNISSLRCPFVSFLKSKTIHSFDGFCFILLFFYNQTTKSYQTNTFKTDHFLNANTVKTHTNTNEMHIKRHDAIFFEQHFCLLDSAAS